MEDEYHHSHNPQVKHVGVKDQENSESMVQAVLIELGFAIYIACDGMRYEGVKMVR
jgi:hypothetical protein